MVGILILAVGMGVLVPAFRVALQNDQHCHLSLLLLEQDPYKRVVPIYSHDRSPFWPRYWRCLVGLPWAGQSFCSRDPNRLGEVCYLAHPGVPKQHSADGLSRWPALSKELDRFWALSPEARTREYKLSPLHQLDDLPLSVKR